MKRLITVFFCLLSIPWVFGAGVKIDDLYYILDNNAKTATVTYSTSSGPSMSDNYSELTSLTIPSSVRYDGIEYSVTKIGEYAFYYCENIKGSLIIPASVTTIGNYAFRNCSGFTGSLTLSNSVASIGDWAFEGCSGFTGDLTLGEMVSWIGQSAFDGCKFAAIKCYSFSPWVPSGAVVDSSIKVFDDSQYQKPLYFPENLKGHRNKLSYDYQSNFWDRFKNIIRTDEKVPELYDIGIDPINMLAMHDDVESIVERNLRWYLGQDDNFDKSQIEWTTSDPNIIYIEDGKFKSNKPGICNLIGRYKDAYFINSFNLWRVEFGVGGLTLIFDEKNKEINYYKAICKENELGDMYLSPDGNQRCLWFEIESRNINFIRNDFEQGAPYGAVVFIFGTEDGQLVFYDNVWGIACDCVILVDASEVILNQHELVLMDGQVYQLEASVKPDNCTLSKEWYSDNRSIAEVGDGVVRAAREGNTIITAQCGTEYASCSVEVLGSDSIKVEPGDGTSEGNENSSVVDNTINGGSLQGNDLTLRVGQTASIKAILPSNLTEMPRLEWELFRSDGIVTMNVSDDTLEASFTGQEIGKVEYGIYIGGGNYIIRGKINVIAENPLISLELEPKEITLAKNAQPVTVKPVYLPANASHAHFEWISSNEEVASVSESGEVTPYTQGETIITATALDGSELAATCTVTVTAPIDDEFEFDFDESVMGGKEGITLYIGDTYQFKPKAREGYVLPDVINWGTSDSRIVSVNESGLVAALQLGSATITASATVSGKEVQAKCLVTVIAIPASSIELSLQEVSLAVDSKYTLTAKIYPENVTNREITWTSGNPSVASIDATGTITAHQVGETVVTATSGEASATCKVTVTPVSPTSIELNIRDMILYIGQSETIQAIVRPPNTTYPTVIWQSNDESIATVSADGKVTGIREGSAIITATCGAVSAECKVTVNPIPASNIEITSGDVTLTIGSSSKLTAKVSPENTTHSEVEWSSSDNSIATIAADGAVTAINIGTAIITAKCGNVSATCTVTVIPVPSEGIVISPTSVTILIGDNYTLSATVYPETTTDKNVTWGSDNPSVASVSSTGVVTALSKGTATITAKNGNSTGTCKVTVNPVVATGISLNVKDETIFVESSTQLVATISPINVTDKTITWTSSKPEIATVSDSGEVYGVSVGTTTVTATIGSVSASCQINVVHRIPDMDPSVSTSNRDIYTLTGQPVNMAVYVEGGEPSGWSYLWTKNGETVSKSSELNITAVNNTETVIAETYRVKVENEIDKVVILSEIFDFIVRIYPPIEDIADGANNGISISTGNGESNKTREGNTITLSVSTPKGGNPNGWNYLWSDRQGEIGHEETIETVATMSAGNSMAVEETPYYLEMGNYSPEGDLWAHFNLEASIDVYRRPQTPLQLLRKGDGTSHTFVAMMPISDTEFEKLAYQLVYGWTDSEGTDHMIEQTNLRYCHADAAVYDDPTNKFWVYSVWNYQDGSVVSSGLRYLDGSADESFDASVFDGSFVGQSTAHQSKSAYYTVDGHYMGTDPGCLVPGIYIRTTVTHGVFNSEKTIIR